MIKDIRPVADDIFMRYTPRIGRTRIMFDEIGNFG